MEPRKETGYEVAERIANQRKRTDKNKSPSKTLNDKYALRHNESQFNNDNNGKSRSSRQTQQPLNIETNNETGRFELLHPEQQQNTKSSNNTSHKKQRRVSSTLSPIRKIITKKMSMAFSRSNSGMVRADISGFQQQEEEKTAVRKDLRWHATFLFLLAVSATAIVLLDTQIKILWTRERDFLDTLDRNTTDTEQRKIIENGLDKLDLYRKLGIALKSLLTVSSILSCVSLLYYYRNLFRLKKIRHFFPRKMSFMRCTPLVKKYLIECVICLFHVPPFLDLYVYIPNEVQVFVILRLYLLGRYLKEKHDLMNSQSTRFLASVTKTELTSMFLFKTFFMQYPFQLILLAYVILLFIGGYGVWLIENRYTYQDTVWMLIITMTTVGFGDLTPKTTVGRFCVGITAIVGIFLMALFISLVNEALMLQRREKRILAYVENQDLTRHRKITALNAIGLWYKYYAHRNKHIRRSGESASFIGGFRNDRTTHQDLMNKIKGKLLETDMFHAVNEWRKIKNARGGNYFAQEFMIEDMKNMMTDLSSKFNELDDKIDNVSVDLKNIQEQNKKKKSVEKKETKEEKEPKTSITTKSHDEIKDSHMRIQNNGNCHYTSPKNINFSNVTRPQLNGGSHNNKNNNYGGLKMEQIDRYVTRSRKNVQDFIQKHQNDDSQVIRKNELIVAFKLLKNQAQIMNNALDDIYYKTRQDICDLENLISSLLVCTDGEHEDTVDYVPSRELPV